MESARSSAHWDAFALETALALKQEVPGGLESLAVDGSSVIVGTSDGQLLLYSIEEPTFTLGARRSLGCGKKPVENVTIVDATAEGAGLRFAAVGRARARPRVG
eukprot:5489389-Prymnesium_polylepis.1